jgi:hypothetical protein
MTVKRPAGDAGGSVAGDHPSLARNARTTSAPDSFEEALNRPRFWFAVYTIGSVFAAGLFVFIFTFYKISESGQFNKAIELVFMHPAVSVGVPFSIVSAITIVLLMRTVAGPIELEAFGVRFKGASGPIIMWILCFGVLVAAVKLVWSLN